MLRIKRAVGQQRIAKPANGGAHNIELVVNLAFRGEFLILHDHRHIIDSPLLWQEQLFTFCIRNEHQSGQPHRHLSAGFTVLVRVEPTGRRPLRWRKRHGTGTSCGNHPLRATVNDAGNLQTVPVHGSLLRQTIMNIDGCRLTLLKLQGWPQQATVVAPGRRQVRAELRFSGLNG